MAETPIGILGRQCLDRRLADRDNLRRDIDRWQLDCNATSQTIEWMFTSHDAYRKRGRHYIPFSACIGTRSNSP